MPPASVLASVEDVVAPDLELLVWIHQTFIVDEAPLYNAEHRHLQAALVGLCWAGAAYSKKGKRVLGQAELGQPSGSNAWKKGEKVCKSV